MSRSRTMRTVASSWHRSTELRAEIVAPQGVHRGSRDLSGLPLTMSVCGAKVKLLVEGASYNEAEVCLQVGDALARLIPRVILRRPCGSLKNFPDSVPQSCVGFSLRDEERFSELINAGTSAPFFGTALFSAMEIL